MSEKLDQRPVANEPTTSMTKPCLDAIFSSEVRKDWRQIHTLRCLYSQATANSVSYLVSTAKSTPLDWRVSSP
jgi:hypothetical protein